MTTRRWVLALGVWSTGGLWLAACGSDEDTGGGGAGGADASAAGASTSGGGGGAAGGSDNGGASGAPSTGGGGAATGGAGGNGGGGASGGSAGTAGSGGEALDASAPVEAGVDAAEAGPPLDAGVPPGVPCVLYGTVSVLGSYGGSLTPRGQATLERYVTDGATRVTIEVTGLAPSTAYGVHVHAGPCSADGLGHYLIDPSLPTGAANEIWPEFTSDASGVGVGGVTVPDHLVRGDALSVVVHDPAQAGAKMACVNFRPGRDGTPVVGNGTVSPFAQAEAADQTINGTIAYTWGSSASTLAVLALTGLDDLGTYTAHVHDRPCDVLDGGSHYKIDPTVSTPSSGNEFWFDLAGISSGGVADSISRLTASRLDAQSVVIHRQTAPASADGGAQSLRVACGDFPFASCVPYEALGGGTVTALAAAAGKGYTSFSVAAPGGVTRGENPIGGTTYLSNVYFELGGLDPNAGYVAYVHDRPCAVDDGGSRYRIVPQAAATTSNVLLIGTSSDGTGVAAFEADFEHLLRADARSALISESSDPNAPIACVDLDTGG